MVYAASYAGDLSVYKTKPTNCDRRYLINI